ncbi:MAG: GNAT family N-acetyltransferase [Actinomycetes bacterium]
MPAAVRLARPGEGAAIAPLYEWLMAPPGTPPADWSEQVAAERLESAIVGPRSAVFIAQDGQQLVGLCTVYLDLLSVRFGQRAWVEDLAVAPTHRSAGIGKALLDQARRWARQRGAARLGLESGQARADAHRFYEREQPAGTSRSFHWSL